jgi:hypothetical protein
MAAHIAKLPVTCKLLQNHSQESLSMTTRINIDLKEYREQIIDFQHANRLPSMAAAIRALIKLGLVGRTNKG